MNVLPHSLHDGIMSTQYNTLRYCGEFLISDCGFQNLKSQIINRKLFRFLVWCIFLASFAKFAQLKADFTQLFFVLVTIVRNLLTHRTLELYEIVLGHTNIYNL